ncbi:MAG: hypothetical protein WCS91_00990 [Bacilli bacterium]
MEENSNPTEKRKKLLPPKWWKHFSFHHPNLNKTIWQFIKFGLIGWVLTVFQYLGYTFLPLAFGMRLAGTEWLWPGITLPYGNGRFVWAILGYDVLRDQSGNVIYGGGLGYFFSWLITYFTTQAINFPLQRNITYKSRRKVLPQVLLYMLANILVTLLSNALNSLWLKPASEVMSRTLYQVCQTFATSGITTIVFFFAFKAIFPEGKAEDSLKKIKETKEEKKDETK